MFQEGNYDVLEISVPANGMNQNIEPDSLPMSFAYNLENIIPSPLGAGKVRNGTKLKKALVKVDSTIIGCFPFTTQEGIKQQILYCQEYVNDITATAMVKASTSSFSFTTDTPERYNADTPVKVVYTLSGSNTLYSNQSSVIIADNDVIASIDTNAFPASAVTIDSIWYSTGTIFLYNLATDALTTLREDMSVACIPRKAYSQGNMILCNGVDKVLTWDGTTLSEMTDYVKEVANTFVRVDNTHFSFIPAANFDITKYQNNNLIRLSVGGVVSNLTVAAVAQALGVTVVTTTTNLPAFTAVSRVEVAYRDWPPTFNFIFIFNDRIWALGPGAAGIKARTLDESLRVYYSYRPNTLTNLFDETTKRVPSISIADKHGITDNLEAICQINGQMVFCGRERTQIWAGRIPGTGGDFSWVNTLSVGIPHGDLLIELDNDTYFITQTGLKSFSTFNVAKQFAATSHNAIDPLIRNQLATISSSNVNYRSSCSFKYVDGGFAGFKIGKNKCLVSLFSTGLYAWSVFSGDFSRAASVSSGISSSLYLGIGNKLYQYADGIDGGEKTYGDKGGDSLISFIWTTPIMHTKGRRFANKKYEITMDYPSSFVIDPLNQLSISVSGDIPKSFSIKKLCTFEKRGDKFGSIPLGAAGGDDEDIGFRLDVPFSFPKQSLKFVASNFWITVSGYANVGEITLKRIRFFGIGERSA